MNVHVLIRETLDWGNATYEDLKNDFVRQVAHRWDSVFHVTYMDCRARLKAITFDSLKVLPSVQIHDYKCFDMRVVKPEDVLLICDDDDWYHPHIVEHLHDQIDVHRSLEYHLIVWPDGAFLCDGAPGLIRKRPMDKSARFIAKTNNYAVSGSFLCSKPERLSQVLGHGHADHYLRSAEPPVMKLTTSLSLVNRHPCSQVVLQRNLRSIDVAEWGEVFRKLIQQYMQRPTLQPLFPWSRAYILQAKAVFREALGM